jgi:hypothetical protein
MERTLKEFCDILDVSPGATAQEVKQAYRDLVQFWHPDKHADKIPRLRQLAEEKMKEINAAYEVLKGGVPREEPQSKEDESTTRTAGSYTNQTAPRPEWVPPQQPTENPNSGCAVAATAVTFLLCVFVFSGFVFVTEVTRKTKERGWFSSPEYETIYVTSWFQVIFWTAIVCGVTYGLVLWKRSEALIWLAIAASIWLKLSDSQKGAQAPKPTMPNFQTR